LVKARPVNPFGINKAVDEFTKFFQKIKGFCADKKELFDR